MLWTDLSKRYKRVNTTNIKEQLMSTSNLKHLETIKENIDKTDALSQEEKSDSFKRIEEWYNEDQAFGVLMADLSEISPNVKSFLADLGLM